MDQIDHPAEDRDPFDRFMDAAAHAVEGAWFHGKVAGTGHPNEDGSSRQGVIACLQPLVELTLDPDPDNQYDPNAIRVLAPCGLQIGFLEARLAREVTNRRQKGIVAICYFRQVRTGDNGIHGVVFGLLQYQLKT